MKYCKDCKFATQDGTYKRCKKSDSAGDAGLCGEMRKGQCGPDAILFEKK